MNKPETSARTRRAWLGRLIPTTVLALIPLTAAKAYAQVPNPAPQAPPGSTFLSQILGWLKYGGLWSAVAGLLIGAIAVAIGHFGSNYGAASAGRKWILGGIGAAALSGLAWTVANTIYTSTS